jgi:phosphoesterase RecJ-like protein
VAEYFGGGGHMHAAGFTVEGKYDQLLKDIPESVEKLIKADQNNPSSRA